MSTTRAKDCVAALPGHLAERCAWTDEHQFAPGGGPVVYWMRSAIRAAENPALDVARHVAAQRGVGLLVYQGLSERYPFASDRHHRFILEGARDAHRDLARSGIESVFHLERPGADADVLRQLADNAGLVVTELFPVQPIRRWTDRLQAGVRTPILQVDAACLAPMPCIPETAIDRAFAFRRAARPWHARLSRRVWPEPPLAEPAPARLSLPFEPVDLERADLGELIASCRIDHGIAPVPGEKGGTDAGMVRWAEFRDGALARYANDRNDPLREGVSRLSPWLHYGMVSPFRIAREASACSDEGNPGADKYLDELLVWRELAWAFCHRRPDHDRLAALPDWARATLEDHAADPRPVVGVERLLRARSGNALWDAAQRSLLAHGELHNNVRMTWGKAIPGWTPDPGTALSMLIDLNHRFALDGRDPASFGGLLWCLGGFDRPFPPARPVLGTVRPRTLATHAKRLDVAAYAVRTRANRYREGAAPLRIAVLGAGIAGLSVARALDDHNVRVALFDKGRRSGGRLATRTSRTDPGRFDHGAPGFAVGDSRFLEIVERWAHDGLVAPWRPCVRDGDSERWDEHVRRLCNDPGRRELSTWRAADGAASLAAALADGLDCRQGHPIVAVEGEPGAWMLRDDTGAVDGPWHWVVSTLPPAQARALLPAGELVETLSASALLPVWTVMFRADVDVAWDVAVPADAAIGLLIRQSDPDTWVAHANPSFAQARLESDPVGIGAALSPAIDRLLDASVEVVHVHRWRHALPRPERAEVPAAPDRYLIDHANTLAQAGDACMPGVEGAFLSGRALAGRLLGLVADSMCTLD